MRENGMLHPAYYMQKARVKGEFESTNLGRMVGRRRNGAGGGSPHFGQMIGAKSLSKFVLNGARPVHDKAGVDQRFNRQVEAGEEENTVRLAEECRKPSIDASVQETAVNVQGV